MRPDPKGKSSGWGLRGIPSGTKALRAPSLWSLTSWHSGSSLPIQIPTHVMSVAWPHKTARGLGPPGSPEPADPNAESCQRRARVPKVAPAGPCKSLITGFPACGEDRQVPSSPLAQPSQLNAGKGLVTWPRPLLAFRYTIGGGLAAQSPRGSCGSRFASIANRVQSTAQSCLPSCAEAVARRHAHCCLPSPLRPQLVT